MTFRQAVEATPSVRGAYRRGLQALGSGHTARIQAANPRRLTGSLNLEAALKAAQSNAPLWDYGIGFRGGPREEAIWVEVHPASSDSVEGMLRKLDWLRRWLSGESPMLRAMTRGGYYWLATDARVAITAHSRQARRLATAGLRGPMRILRLE